MLDEAIAGLYSMIANMMPDDGDADRIILIGAHGTGKTTLANKLKELLGVTVVESVSREFYKDMKYLDDASVLDKRISKVTKTSALQNVMCSMSRWDYMRWVNVEEAIIMTRCPLDTLAYARADQDVTSDIYVQNLNILKENQEFMDSLKTSLFVYLPIEFDIEDDGTRPMDKEFQKAVDQAMRDLMYEFQITPLVVTGTVKERVEQIIVKMAGKDFAPTIMRGYKD